MYFQKGFVVVLTIVSLCDFWNVEGLRHRRTTKPPLSENTTVGVGLENESDRRYHHNQPISTQNPLQYPPPSPPQSPLHNPQPIIPQYPPHYPPQDPPQVPSQIPSQYPPQNIPQTVQQYPPSYPPSYLPQPPPQVTPQKPLPSPPQVPPQYPPHSTPQIIQPHPPQYLPQNPPQIIAPTSPYYPQHKPPQNPPAILTLIPPKVTTIIDQFDNRFSDGSYEFRYALSDDSVRYERGYFIYYQQTKILVVKGYYSHRLPDLRYLTVFYTADQFGNRQNSYFSTYRPQLPRSLNTETDSIEEVFRSSDEDISTGSEAKL